MVRLSLVKTLAIDLIAKNLTEDELEELAFMLLAYRQKGLLLEKSASVSAGSYSSSGVSVCATCGRPK